MGSSSPTSSSILFKNSRKLKKEKFRPNSMNEARLTAVEEVLDEKEDYTLILGDSPRFLISLYLRLFESKASQFQQELEFSKLKNTVLDYSYIFLATFKSILYNISQLEVLKNQMIILVI